MKNDIGTHPLNPSSEFSQSHNFDGIDIKLELMSKYIAAVVSSNSWSDFPTDKSLCEQMYNLANETILTYQQKECLHKNQETDQDGRTHCADCGLSFN